MIALVAATTLQTLDGRELALAEADVAGLAGSLGGSLVRDGDPDYEAARRVWNGMIDRRPALIVRAAGMPDVVEAVRFARRHGLPVAVRGGGHGVAGHAAADGALVIDLDAMRDVDVDVDRRLARAGEPAGSATSTRRRSRTASRRRSEWCRRPASQG
jgi:hypothetical protein